MSIPEFKNFDQILQEMIDLLIEKGTKLSDLNPNSILRTFFEVAAAKIDESYYTAEQVLNLFFAATTTGSYLDMRAAERGLSRNQGQKASGNISCSRSTPAPISELIPAGTMFATEDGLVELQSTTDVAFSAGSTSVQVSVVATEVGAAGNLQEGVALKQVGIAVSLIETISVASPGLKNGVDVETDDELRERYLAYLRAPGTSGNKADYVKWALEVDGVGGVQVIPLWSGRGTVKIIVLDGDKNPASQELVDAVQAYIAPDPGQGEGKAPIGATVTVVPATSVAVDIAATIITDGTRTIEEIQTDFMPALIGYLKSIAFSGDTVVRYSRIGTMILDTVGVIDYSDLLVNEGTANIPIASGSVAVPGTVTLS
ncbi:phage-like element PBSX protein xkdT [Desulfocucumis palustris]|uniref:Phage-like element PBSX protein xkdT n=1 Tax=Desulfocucumis palustris TaxID=1898651 RepID=A0A2L2XDD6_9FIRM|nr:baseplate J/gp47 family protein [Desulfocucumis palustris]GBF34152.1 phage-like element PBSX protein xkdT [Desulfocucumis palustris]